MILDDKLKLLLIIAVVIILFLQGAWMFRDAERNGHNKWLWGLLGLIQFPTYLLIYMLFVRRRRRND
ncbi:sigma-Y antisigma factor component [Paenibacillaceae bacterium]|nr:sigma-Y antisigma factor component [Paenibacillaceae bacterium]